MELVQAQKHLGIFLTFDTPLQSLWNGTCNTIFEVVHIHAQKQKFLGAGAIDMLLTCTSENTFGVNTTSHSNGKGFVFLLKN
jgi:hypothetical protein